MVEESPPSSRQLAPDGSISLVVQDDDGKVTAVPIVRAETLIGRQGCTIRLTEWNVSRKHARLSIADGAIAIEDLGSANGVKVNGVRIAGRRVLRLDDRIEIADYVLTLRHTAAAAATAAAITEPSVPAVRTAAALARTDDHDDDTVAATTTRVVPRIPEAEAELEDGAPPARAGRGTRYAIAGALGLAAVVAIILVARGRGGGPASSRRVASVVIDAGAPPPPPPPAIDATAAAVVDEPAPVVDAAEALPEVAIDAAPPLPIDAAPPPPIDAAPPPPPTPPLDAAASAPVSPDQVVFDRFSAAARAGNVVQAVALYRQIPDDSRFAERATAVYEQLHARYLRERKAQAATLARVGKCSELRALATESGRVFPDAREAIESVPCEAGTGGGSTGGSATGSGGGSATPAGPTAAALIADAQAAAKASQWSRALSLAERALAAGPDDAGRAQAVSIAALSACSIPDAAKARRYATLMPPNRQAMVRQRCLASGVELE